MLPCSPRCRVPFPPRPALVSSPAGSSACLLPHPPVAVAAHTTSLAAGRCSCSPSVPTLASQPVIASACLARPAHHPERLRSPLAVASACSVRRASVSLRRPPPCCHSRKRGTRERRRDKGRMCSRFSEECVHSEYEGNIPSRVMPASHPTPTLWNQIGNGTAPFYSNLKA